MEMNRMITVTIIFLLMIGPSMFVQSQKDNFYSSQSDTSSDPIPEHMEYIQPSRNEAMDLGGYTKLDIYYDYQMNYDLPPRDLVLYLDGGYMAGSATQLKIQVHRPDGKTVNLLDKVYSENGVLDEKYRFFGSPTIKQNIYNFGLRFEGDYSDDMIDADINGALFGEAGDTILSDPEVLKGEYTIQITLVGEHLDMRYGEDKTVLKVMSLPPGPVQDLKAKVGDSKVTLDWEPPNDKGGSDMIRYNIYRADTVEEFQFIDKVSGSTTSYTDKTVNDRTLYFYKVAPINLDTKGVEAGDDPRVPGINDPSWRSDCERVPALPSSEEKKEKPSRAYRWWMDYSYLTEDYIEERIEADVSVHKISGIGKCLYKIDEKGKENGLKKYTYKGGYYSSGEANITLDYGGTSLAVKAEVKETSIKFSGDLWVQESERGENKENTVYAIKRQTVDCSGKVDMEYEYVYRSGGSVKQTSEVDLNMDWNLSLEMDFEKPAVWLSMDSSEPIYGEVVNFDHSGDVSGDIDLIMHSSGVYSDRDVNIDTRCSGWVGGQNTMWAMTESAGQARAYSPILGSAKIGYYEVLDETVGIDNNVIGEAYYTEDIKRRMPFRTNNQRVHTSEGSLYTRQYLDPMAMPGLLSVLQAGVVRADIVYSDYLEAVVYKDVRMKMMTDPEIINMSAEQKESWRENETERLKQKYYKETLTEPCWEIWDQQTSIDGTLPHVSGAPSISVVGFFESESVEKAEVDSFLEDMEGYTKDERGEGIGWHWIALGMSVPVVILLIVLSLLRYQKTNKNQ